MASLKKPKTATGTSPAVTPGAHTYPASSPAGAHGRHVAEVSSAYLADPQTRIDIIRQGIPAARIGDLAARMGISKENLLAILGMSRATISRKEKNAALLSKDESERVLGIEMLIGTVQAMVEQSGDPAGFDAARWLAGWLANPVPALAGATPASYMDTFEGQKLLANLLAMSQSGVYA
ncbi:antitoxin Xre-like helix-turn-helix domain-containing protein [Telluria beijingensis]|uniref:antitoxin Xre-like helix-turn-helix domain-containing protein n=1 Tax=Telluria beijingensis TaxID=3068633 RepID=UPI002795D33B|nr:antitoxin Xre-like helix-turn-helix domain-containing protein [Massilia sp. REN29]